MSARMNSGNPIFCFKFHIFMKVTVYSTAHESKTIILKKLPFVEVFHKLRYREDSLHYWENYKILLYKIIIRKQ